MSNYVNLRNVGRSVMMDVAVNCVQPCWPMKQVLLELDNNNLMALTLIVFVAVMFCKVSSIVLLRLRGCFPVAEYCLCLQQFCSTMEAAVCCEVECSYQLC